MRRVLALVLFLPLVARTLWAAAPIPWTDAGGHVGDNVTVEGDVVAASSTPDQVVLEFAPADPHAFRVVLIVPLMTDLPRFPERLYQGRRVRASGVVQRFHGRPEMVLRSPGQIEVIDVAGAPPATPPTTAPPPPAAIPAPPTLPPPVPTTVPPPLPVPSTVPPPPVSAPAPAPVAPPPAPAAPPAPAVVAPPPAAPPVATPSTAPFVAPPPPTTSTSTSSTLPARTPVEVLAELRCSRAKDRWQEAARHATELGDQLRRCLATTSYRCRAEAAAMTPALSELEWAEQQVADACP